MALDNPHPHPSSTSIVSSETVGRAVDSLLKWKKSKAKQQTPQLLEQDDFIYLILTIKKIPPKARTNPYKITLPNPLHSSEQEICLIIDDRAKSRITSEAAKNKIKAENIPVSKVLKLSKLKSDYRPFEAKRKLCDSFDLFFSDKRVIPLLPRLLGKQFFKKKKIPVPIALTQKNWKEQIEHACGSALLYLRTGSCSVLKVGRVSHGRDEIIANVVAAIDGVVEIIPKKWGNVRSLHLKFSESLALPVYQAVPDMGLKIEGVKKKEEGTEKEGGGVVVESGDNGRVVEEKKLGTKKGSKKGRIHEVRYMDNILDKVLDDDDDDDDELINNEDTDSTELGNTEIAGRKRKKVSSLKRKHVLNELNGEKQRKEEDAVKHKHGSGNKLVGDQLVGSSMSISGGVKKKKKTSSKLLKSENRKMKLKS